MQEIRSIIILLFICIASSWTRRILNSNDYDVDEYDDDDDYGRVENVVDYLVKEVSDIKDKYLELQRHGGDNRKTHEDEMKDKKASLSTGLSKQQKRKAYKDYLEKISRVKTVEDFKRIFNVPERTSFKRQTIPTAGTPIACDPKDTSESVSFQSSVERIWPTCITVKRCGGCCDDINMQCVAASTQQKQINVYKISMSDSSFAGYHTVDYTDHTSCSCQCKRQQSDCLPTQTLDPTTCTCECQSQPQSCPEGKQWSTFDCACVCSNHSPSCPTNHVWNKNTCQCDRINFPSCSSGLLNSNTCTCN